MVKRIYDYDQEDRTVIDAYNDRPEFNSNELWAIVRFAGSRITWRGVEVFIEGVGQAYQGERTFMLRDDSGCTLHVPIKVVEIG